MPTIADLSQRNPCVDVDEECDLAALYEGGKAIKARLSRFMPQRPRETHDRYEVRKREFHYRNYLGPIIDYFAAMLFTSKPTTSAKAPGGTSSEPSVPDFYAAFREDCDGLGCDLDAFFKDRITQAMIQRRAWFAIEQPDVGESEPADLAEFESRGLGDMCLKALDCGAVLDWETDADGELEWVLTYRRDSRRQGISARRGAVYVDTWEHYQLDRVDTYQITIDDEKKPDPSTAEVRLVSTRRHRLGRVPVFCIELPYALWAANRLSTPQLAHLRAINGQSWSLSNTCYAMPVALVGDPDKFIASKAVHGPGHAIVLGLGESWQWEAPPTAHFAALDTEIKAHKDEIFRTAHQMALGVDNNAAAIGRTAESKAADVESTRVILTAYAAVVKEAIELVYDTISRARGDNLVWSVGGLDDFASADLGWLAEVLTKLQPLGAIPSKTLRGQLFKRLAEGLLPDLDEATKATIRKEIEAGTAGDSVDTTGAQLRKTVAEADAAYVNSGVYLPEEIALLRAQPNGYALEMTISNEARQARKSAVADQMDQLAAGEPEPSPPVTNVPNQGLFEPPEPPEPPQAED